MSLSLSWQQYAEWLYSVNGMHIEDAVKKALELYGKQYKKLVKASEINKFYEERYKDNAPDQIRF